MDKLKVRAPEESKNLYFFIWYYFSVSIIFVKIEVWLFAKSIWSNSFFPFFSCHVQACWLKYEQTAKNSVNLIQLILVSMYLIVGTLHYLTEILMSMKLWHAMLILRLRINFSKYVHTPNVNLFDSCISINVILIGHKKVTLVHKLFIDRSSGVIVISVFLYFLTQR